MGNWYEYQLSDDKIIESSFNLLDDEPLTEEDMFEDNEQPNHELPTDK